MLFRNGEAIRRSQLVVGVERRRVTHRAAFALENLLSALSQRVEFVWIGRRLERIDVKSQGVKLFITIAAQCRSVWQLLEAWSVSRNEPIVVGNAVTAIKYPSIHRGVTHQVPDRAVGLKTGAVKIAPVFHTDQVWNLSWMKQVRPVTGKNTRRKCIHS